LRIFNDTKGEATKGGDRVVQLVKNGIAFYKASGRDIALAEFSSPRGQFVKDQFYLFVLDLKGVMVAHGVNEKFIGKNWIDVKDSDAKSMIREIVETGRSKGYGWVEFKWYHPVTKETRPKTTYFEKIDDFIICSGFYQDILVQVMDTGSGIPGEELPWVFDDFYRGKDAPGGGAGVGLSIVKRIVEAHAGRIWAESPYPESEKGAKFTFTLPRGQLSPRLEERGDAQP
jgi:hypothetical protein